MIGENSDYKRVSYKIINFLVIILTEHFIFTCDSKSMSTAVWNAYYYYYSYYYCYYYCKIFEGSLLIGCDESCDIS